MPVPPVKRIITPLATALLLALAALGLDASGALASTSPNGYVRIGTAPKPGANTVPLAAVSSEQKLSVTVALKPRNAAALAAYADAVSDPDSPDYGHYLSTAVFAKRFGPSTTTIEAVEAALRRQGLQAEGLQSDHLSFRVRADAGTLERSFHVELAHMLLADDKEAVVNLQAPAVPAAIAGDVQAIEGLDGLQTMRSNRLRDTVAATGATRTSLPSRAATSTTHRSTKQTPEPCSAASSAASSQGAYTANQIASAYSFDGLYAAGDEGAGVTIGVYELEPNSASDIAAYQSCYGTATPITYEEVDGGAGTGDGSGEAAFDIEQVIGLAPKATLIVYQGPNSDSDDPGSGPYDVFADMISQDKVSIITNSWGECEAVEGRTDAAAENTLFEEAAVQGQTVISASGDDGSEDCLNSEGGYEEQLAVDDPGSQPFVTDVGGTSMTADSTPPTETVWNSGGGTLSTLGVSNGSGAGGGGISDFWTMPSYQADAPASLNVINADSSASDCGASSGDCREVPDVAADADPAHGYLIYYNGDGAERGQPVGWQSTGGTSGAAPLWAAVFALTNADSACADDPIGFANPALYRAAAAGESTYFNDVTSGNNDFTDTNHGLYPATAGYDMASGLGTPNATALATELCEQSLRLTVPVGRQSWVSAPVTAQVGVADGTGIAVSVSVSGLPAGVSYNASTGLISGTPTAPGVHVVTITAVDSDGATRTGSFVLDVAAHPTISHLKLTGVSAGKPVLSLRVTAGKAEAKLDAIAVTLPADVSVKRAAGVVVRSLSTGKTVARTIVIKGRRVTLGLKTATSPVVVQFEAGALRGATALTREANRRTKPTLKLSVVVKDAALAVTSLTGSVKPTS